MGKLDTLSNICIELIGSNFELYQNITILNEELRCKILQIVLKKTPINDWLLNLFMTPNQDSISLYGCFGLTEDSLIKIPQFCHHLTKIKFKSCLNFNTRVITNYLQYCGNLTTLNLNNCSKLLDSDIEAIAAGCGDTLEYLNLYSCYQLTNRSTAAIANSCNQLQKLNIGYCQYIDSTGVKNLARNCTLLEKLILTSLQYLDDSTLIEVSNYCTILTTLDIENCSQISESAIQKVSEGLCLLENLSLAWCRLSDISITSLAQNCGGLLELDLSHTDVTDIGMMQIANNCKSIHTINLKVCQRITSEGIQTLVKGLGVSLRKLNLDSVINVNDDSIRQLLISCPMLNALDISFCRNVSPEAVEATIESMRLLKELHIFGFKVRPEWKMKLFKINPSVKIQNVDYKMCKTNQET